MGFIEDESNMTPIERLLYQKMQDDAKNLDQVRIIREKYKVAIYIFVVFLACDGSIGYVYAMWLCIP